MRTFQNIDEIIEHLKDYPDLDGSGLKVWPPSKRKFKWEENTEGSLYQLLALQIMEYFQETRISQEIASGAEDFYERGVVHTIDDIKEKLKVLEEAAISFNSKRSANKLRKMIKDIDALELDLRTDLMPRYEKMVKNFSSGVGDLDSVGAQTRVRIRLYDVLHSYTNLTINDKIEHIVQLLIYFDIMNDDPDDKGFESVKQSVFGDRRNREMERINQMKSKKLQNLHPD